MVCWEKQISVGRALLCNMAFVGRNEFERAMSLWKQQQKRARATQR